MSGPYKRYAYCRECGFSEVYCGCPKNGGCTAHTGECGCVCQWCGRVGGQLCKDSEDCEHVPNISRDYEATP